MVNCCVPTCNTTTWKCDSDITFHDFPTIPDLTAKWIKQISAAVRTKEKPMWFPRGRPVICSKHFLQTDFREDSDTLKPHSIPTVFGHKYIGYQPNDDCEDSVRESKKSPLIVKINKPSENANSLLITSVFSKAADTQVSKNDSSKIVSSVSPCAKALVNHSDVKRSLLRSLPCKMGVKLNQSNLNILHNKNLIYEKKHLTAPKSSPLKSYLSPKKKSRKIPIANNLIEIGPNTFLKINPDIIKVNKKQTPSGNTVLQFIMDQKVASSQASNILPTLIQGISNTASDKNSETDENAQPELSIEDVRNESEQVPNKINKNTVVQHVLGHLVDTHTCMESCAEEEKMDIDNASIDKDNEIVLSESQPNFPIDTSTIYTPTENTKEISSNSEENILSKDKADVSVLNKAPVLFTTNLPLSHCMMEKPKYQSQLRQKSRQIASLKFKINSLTKKIEELEDRCIVQERQLSYSFIRRLKAIRKNANKGDPCATYILEQIRCYSGKTKMRWSDTTLSQCAVWCRKAPYAYEYFKKADFFKLPCLGTVKRFMKKHPEMKFQNKSNSSNPGEYDSSSDFDFDESESFNEDQENSDVEKLDSVPACEAVLCDTSESVVAKAIQEPTQPDKVVYDIEAYEGRDTSNTNNSKSVNHQSNPDVSEKGASDNTEKSTKLVEVNTFPVTVDTSNLELQEIILPSGEVVQCYSSNLCNGTDSGNQYYIIPNVTDQPPSGDHEYNVVQTGESLPLILQNLDNAQLPLQQEQLIFITNSSDQVECSETEVITA